MKNVLCLWIFYKKLIIPSLSTAVLVGMTGWALTNTFSLKWTGFAYVFLAPLFHYFIYEVRNSNEYYFYYNLGLSRTALWASTFLVSLVAALILNLL
jgi:hypothetical protein